MLQVMDIFFKMAKLRALFKQILPKIIGSVFYVSEKGIVEIHKGLLSYSIICKGKLC